MPLGVGLHILPMNDLIAHESRPDCVCGPEVTHQENYDDGTFVNFRFQHHALDGRPKPETE